MFKFTPRGNRSKIMEYINNAHYPLLAAQTTSLLAASATPSAPLLYLQFGQPDEAMAIGRSGQLSPEHLAALQ